MVPPVMGLVELLPVMGLVKLALGSDADALGDKLTVCAALASAVLATDAAGAALAPGCACAISAAATTVPPAPGVAATCASVVPAVVASCAAVPA